MLLSTVFLACCTKEEPAATKLTGSPNKGKTERPKKKPSKEKYVKKLAKPPAYKGKLNSISKLNIRDAKLQNVLTGLEYPWAFEFINNEELLLTEISGNLYHFNLTTGKKTSLGGLPEIGSGFPQIGLLDIEIHPDFKNNQRIYFSYSKPDPETHKYHVTEVATAVIKSGHLQEVTPLINNKHYGWAPSNFGGALEFDDQGYLYITIGDRGAHTLTQRGDRLEGKVLRLHADGSTPIDNPFVNDRRFDPRIYALGVRNAQGLHFDQELGILFETEHGPLGGDEVNIINAGLNYGWPTISYGSNYATVKPMGIGTHRDGLEQPLFYYLPSTAISPITIYRGEVFKEWNGDLLVGALKGAHVSKLDYDNGVIRSSVPILKEVGGRIRDIKVAPDGSIYILSQNTGLFRLHRDRSVKKPGTPAKATKIAAKAAPPKVHGGKRHYSLVCSGCHDSGASGAPILGNYGQWKPIIEQPIELTRKHVMEGFNNMPEKGLCHTCSEAGLMQIVDYIFSVAKAENVK